MCPFKIRKINISHEELLELRFKKSKTFVIHRFTEDKFYEEYVPTIFEAMEKSTTAEINGENVNVFLR